ncbi:MAG: hypothetical protein A2Z08_07165 [Deltaproteobacteria bacterium RBG_16_54_11]|jgi:hypothetical protein|nr:MAG: hypothetical protein A2Z08_07165 [Deltaproteobacteria bacterium RBG_16_54_11]
MDSFLDFLINLIQVIKWPLLVYLLFGLFKKDVQKTLKAFSERLKRGGMELGASKNGVKLKIDDIGTKATDVPEPAKPLPKADESRLPLLEAKPSGHLPPMMGGFFESLPGGSFLIQKMEVLYDPWLKEAEGKIYELGQKVEFSILNFTKNGFEFPLCAVEFPKSFMHLDTEHPESGRLTINSDLWGLGGQLTQLRELSDEMMEISSVPTRILKSNEGLRFFVRFNLPNITKEYTLRIKFGRMGQVEESSNLLLNVRKSKKKIKIKKKIKTKIKKK